MKSKKLLLTFLPVLFVFFSLLVLPSVASAHEVYVLNSAEINSAIHTPSFNMLDTVRDNLPIFGFFTLVGIVTVLLVLYISTRRFLQNIFNPFFQKTKKYSVVLGRITIGLSLVAGGYFHATYGPELPISVTYGSLASFVAVVMIILGICIIIGFRVRAMALIALAMYAIAVRFFGTYMLTYINYFGEILLLLILGGHSWSIDSWLEKKGIGNTSFLADWWQKISDYLAPKSYAIMRVLFGISLIYSSAYAKIIHNYLALDTVAKYHLDKIFGMEPHFLVLGAAIVEITIGLFFILGIEIRFTSLFFLTFLTMSLLFFGEAVWPHIILIGLPITFILYGYDKYSLEGYIFVQT